MAEVFTQLTSVRVITDFDLFILITAARVLSSSFYKICTKLSYLFFTIQSHYALDPRVLAYLFMNNDPKRTDCNLRFHIFLIFKNSF